uniref:Uncharacterized protein n=1 Tax=Cucumis melo TaxID=3656 RepID=A0A9I9EIK2_CUCME
MSSTVDFDLKMGSDITSQIAQVNISRFPNLYNLSQTKTHGTEILAKYFHFKFVEYRAQVCFHLKNQISFLFLRSEAKLKEFLNHEARNRDQSCIQITVSGNTRSSKVCFINEASIHFVDFEAETELMTTFVHLKFANSGAILYVGSLYF